MSERVVIVGGGVIGMFCAVTLARMGARVTLLESEAEDFTPYAPAASLAAAGMLAPLIDVDDDAEFDALALESYDLWLNLSKGAAWEDGMSFRGGVAAFSDDAGAQKLAAKIEQRGRKAQLLNNGAVRKRIGVDNKARAGVFVADEALADPPRVLSGLVMAARSYGAQIRYRQDVATVTARGVTTVEGALFEADHIVLSPGAWASDAIVAAAPALKHIRPAKGHMVPVSTERALGCTLHGSGFYLAPQLNGLVLGATMEFDRWDRGVDQARVDELLAAVAQLLPGALTPRDRPWTGIRPMSPDGAPLIGKSGDVLVACGHSRNGWLLAPLTAEIICAHVLGSTPQPQWSRFSPDRFETKP